MSQNYVFRKYATLQDQVPWVPIVQRPTALERLRAVGTRWGQPELYIKREDQTDDLYGGNKVRNLEFIIGDALARGCPSLSTLVAYGSNFTGALSAQAHKHGLALNLSQFVVYQNPQIDATAEFSQHLGARLYTYHGRTGPVRAGLNAAQHVSRGRLGTQATYWVSPGASNLRGALGHTNAPLELAAQCQAGEAPVPDYLVVGAGTCGTIAGLLAGLQVARLPTQVIGVRCASAVVCNRRRVLRLANQVLAVLDPALRVTPRDFALVESPQDIGYAIPIKEAIEVMDELKEHEGLALDTTYTSKVMLWLKQAVRRREFAGRRLLYWHTFSPAAVQWKGLRRYDA